MNSNYSFQREPTSSHNGPKSSLVSSTTNADANVDPDAIEKSFIPQYIEEEVKEQPNYNFQENLNPHISLREQVHKGLVGANKPKSGNVVENSLNKCKTANNDLQRAADDYKKSYSTELLTNYKQQKGDASTISIGGRSLRNTAARQQRPEAQKKGRQELYFQPSEGSQTEQQQEQINLKAPFTNFDSNSMAVISKEKGTNPKFYQRQPPKTNRSHNDIKRIARKQEQLPLSHQNQQFEDFNHSQELSHSQLNQPMIDSPQVLHRTANLPIEDQILQETNINQAMNHLNMNAKHHHINAIHQIKQNSLPQQTFSYPAVKYTKNCKAQNQKEDTSPGSFKSAEVPSSHLHLCHSQGSLISKPLKSNRKPKKPFDQQNQKSSCLYQDQNETKSPRETDFQPTTVENFKNFLEKQHNYRQTNLKTTASTRYQEQCQIEEGQAQNEQPMTSAFELEQNVHQAEYFQQQNEQQADDEAQLMHQKGHINNKASWQPQLTQNQSDAKMKSEFKSEVSASKIQAEQQQYNQEEPLPVFQCSEDQDEDSSIKPLVQPESCHMVVDQLSHVLEQNPCSSNHSRTPSDSEMVNHVPQNPEEVENLQQEQESHQHNVQPLISSQPVPAQLSEFQYYVLSFNQRYLQSRPWWNRPNGFLMYAESIYAWLRKQEFEGSSLINIQYMTLQGQINKQMREVLVDWLIDVHQRFKLMPETLFITINIVDRFLGKANCSRERLQLLGTTAMLIACKYEEIHPPNLSDLVFMCNNAYQAADVLEMEHTILLVLEFDMTFVTCLNFLETYLEALQIKDLPTMFCTRFFLETSLLYLPLQKYSPSTLALASLISALRLFHRQPCYAQIGLGLVPHEQKLVELINLEAIQDRQLFAQKPEILEIDVYMCANDLDQLPTKYLADDCRLTAIRSKYSHNRMVLVHPLLNLPVRYPPVANAAPSPQQTHGHHPF